MKNTIQIKLFILLLLTVVSLGSCEISDPVKPVEEEKDPAITWIDETMRKWYLWEDEIPAAEKLDYKLGAEEFFASLLSDKDGKGEANSHYYYSSINKKQTASKGYHGDAYSYGFEFQYYNLTHNGSTLYYVLQVLYVLPDSPAAEKGMKRGDWIMQINRQPIPGNTLDLLNALDTSTPTATVFGLNDELPKTPTAKTEITMTPRMVVDNPVFVDTTFVYGSGKHRISYLAFNHFTAGRSDGDETFHNSLRKAFAGFKSNSPEDFILDLRYNQGGLVRTAQILTTMLAPASAMNNIFCRFAYNKKFQGARDSMLLDPRLIKDGTAGANLDLKRIFIITSNRTASASEAVINGLEPYMRGQVILVGSKTEGKNVASNTFSDDKYDWELHPIISRISNKDDFSDYANGFQPAYACVETAQDILYELGDVREFMLKQVLDYIVDGKPIDNGLRAMHAADMPELVPVYCSIERRGNDLIMGN
ncbi:MAG: hypothetical protein LBH04_04305 [Tannerellaceae bacterium]|jgi:C-terminal processing protease CtpA/Prc|nr:hypothetical protein [Tannerellaceae bacterium]